MLLLDVSFANLFFDSIGYTLLVLVLGGFLAISVMALRKQNENHALLVEQDRRDQSKNYVKCVCVVDLIKVNLDQSKHNELNGKLKYHAAHKNCKACGGTGRRPVKRKSYNGGK